MVNNGLISFEQRCLVPPNRNLWLGLLIFSCLCCPPSAYPSPWYIISKDFTTFWTDWLIVRVRPKHCFCVHWFPFHRCCAIVAPSRLVLGSLFSLAVFLSASPNILRSCSKGCFVRTIKGWLGKGFQILKVVKFFHQFDIDQPTQR